MRRLGAVIPAVFVAIAAALWITSLEGELDHARDDRRANQQAIEALEARADAAEDRAADAAAAAKQAQWDAAVLANQVRSLGGTPVVQRSSAPAPAAPPPGSTTPPAQPCTLNPAGICVPQVPGL